MGRGRGVKIRHKINHGWSPDHTDPTWADRVEREAERTSTAAAKRYAKAQENYQRALAKAEKAGPPKSAKPKVRNLWAEVERRRAELKRWEALVTATPAGSQHRGKGSYRGVGTGEAL